LAERSVKVKTEFLIIQIYFAPIRIEISFHPDGSFHRRSKKHHPGFIEGAIRFR